jgi:hypothetical protein
MTSRVAARLARLEHNTGAASPRVVVVGEKSLEAARAFKAFFANLPYHLVHITCSNFVFQRVEREMVPRPLNPMRRRCF